MRELSDKTMKKVQKTAEKVVDKVFASRLRKMELPKQVRIARAMLKTVGGDKFKVGFLKDDGFPGDLRALLDEGKSREEIKGYYWGCEDFRRFWLGELGFTEELLDHLISSLERG